MVSRLLSSNSITKTWNTFHDLGNGEFVIDSKSDVSDVIEMNKSSMAVSNGRDRWGDGQIVATIPNIIYWDLVRRGIMDDEKALRKWLNDPANSAFRRRSGRV